jgi:hypothetical protein
MDTNSSRRVFLKGSAIVGMAHIVRFACICSLGAVFGDRRRCRCVRGLVGAQLMQGCEEIGSNRVQYRARPPDISKTAPVLNALAGEQSHKTIAATSSTLPKRLGDPR